MTCDNCGFYRETKVRDLGLCGNPRNHVMKSSLIDSQLQACPMFVQALHDLQAATNAHQAA